MTKGRWALAALIVLIAGLFWFWNSEWLEIDACLDSGGRWDKKSGHCQHQVGAEG